jgi:bifunctional ADP-heptose synthase (sugar kinase/adenylyltransferase)
MEQIVGAEEVKAWRGQVVIVPLVQGKCSSDIVRSIQSAQGNSCGDNQQEND